MEKREIACIPVRKLRPDQRNARIHPKKQIRQIANSYRRFGWTNPIIIDENYTILTGHGRYQAVLQLGLREWPFFSITEFGDDDWHRLLRGRAC